jgi:hypothetical protein
MGARNSPLILSPSGDKSSTETKIVHSSTYRGEGGLYEQNTESFHSRWQNYS